MLLGFFITLKRGYLYWHLSDLTKTVCISGFLEHSPEWQSGQKKDLIDYSVVTFERLVTLMLFRLFQSHKKIHLNTVHRPWRDTDTCNKTTILLINLWFWSECQTLFKFQFREIFAYNLKLTFGLLQYFSGFLLTLFIISYSEYISHVSVAATTILTANMSKTECTW